VAFIYVSYWKMFPTVVTITLEYRRDVSFADNYHNAE